MSTALAAKAHIPPSSAPTASGHAPRDTLQTFRLDDLAQYTHEGAFGPTASPDFRVFYVGRDDVHGVLVHLFTRVGLSVKMNMFGFDDDQLKKSEPIVTEYTQKVKDAADKAKDADDKKAAYGEVRTIRTEGLNKLKEICKDDDQKKKIDETFATKKKKATN